MTRSEDTQSLADTEEESTDWEKYAEDIVLELTDGFLHLGKQ